MKYTYILQVSDKLNVKAINQYGTFNKVCLHYSNQISILLCQVYLFSKVVQTETAIFLILAKYKVTKESNEEVWSYSYILAKYEVVMGIEVNLFAN